MAVLDVMQEEGLWDNARDTGRYFKARLQALVDKHPLAGAAHGSGFYLGLELVRDRATLEPATEETMLLCDRLRELGIFMQPTGDHLNILKIKPPMCTTRPVSTTSSTALTGCLARACKGYQPGRRVVILSGLFLRFADMAFSSDSWQFSSRCWKRVRSLPPPASWGVCRRP